MKHCSYDSYIQLRARLTALSEHLQKSTGIFDVLLLIFHHPVPELYLYKIYAYIYVYIHCHFVCWRREKNNFKRFLYYTEGNETEDWLLNCTWEMQADLMEQEHRKIQMYCIPWPARDSIPHIHWICELILSRNHIWSRSTGCYWTAPKGYACLRPPRCVSEEIKELQLRQRWAKEAVESVVLPEKGSLCCSEVTVSPAFLLLEALFNTAWQPVGSQTSYSGLDKSFNSCCIYLFIYYFFKTAECLQVTSLSLYFLTMMLLLPCRSPRFLIRDLGWETEAGGWVPRMLNNVFMVPLPEAVFCVFFVCCFLSSHFYSVSAVLHFGYHMAVFVRTVAQERGKR